jgi:uncharacterized protein (DUF427 family)
MDRAKRVVEQRHCVARVEINHLATPYSRLNTLFANFPRDDIAMPFLEASTKSTHCPHKGDAVYFDIESKSATLKNAAWSYETPLESVERIANHVAFYDGEATVEQL